MGNAGIKEDVSSPQTLSFDNMVIDLTRREVLLDGQVLLLKPKEYELLLFFAQHKRQMLSREFILERVWGWEYIGDSRTVDVHVRWLRQKIEADPSRRSGSSPCAAGATASKGKWNHTRGFQQPVGS